MMTTKILWIVIVGAVVLGLIFYYLYHEENLVSGLKHRFIEIEHNDRYYDDDDCDDYE